MGRLLLTALQAAHATSLRGAWRRFERAAADPERAQARRLEAIAKGNADTAYGREHGFASIGSAGDWQRRVPIVDYDALAPWIERIALGEGKVLAAEPVVMMEPSGGSTSAQKLVPYTRGLLAEFAAATGPWLRDLYLSCPGLWGTRSYWSVSAVTRERTTTSGGVPIGMDDDTEYFASPVERWALKRMLAVPSAVARLPDMARWRKATLGHLLEAADLGLLSVWSPTFLSRLMQALAEDLERLLAAISPARAHAVRRAIEAAGTVVGEAIWPRLALVSCWTDGTAADFLPELRRWFPNVQIQGKGLLATEGVVSFPLWGRPGAVAAVAGHFLEFIDLDHPQGDPLLAHDLREGGSYSPLLTTSGGLYRYHLKDEVRCVGHYRRAPLLRFEGKLDRVSDLCGEKLNARQVDQALAHACDETGLRYEFAMLAPVRPGDGAAPFYCLFVETDSGGDVLDRALATIEKDLSNGHPYRYCRDLGQLGPLRARRVRDGWKAVERTLTAQGQRAGDIKPTHLDKRSIWEEVFAGSRAIPRAGRGPRHPEGETR